MILNHKNKNYLLYKWVLIPLCLLLFWFVLSSIYLMSSDFSPTVLSYNHKGEKQVSERYNSSNVDFEWTGKFVAKDNYLGIIAIEFSKTDKPIFDRISFMIKEEGSLDWHEINQYDARQFYYLNRFPFGIKAIPDSKGKTYEFKFISTTGQATYQASLEKIDPIVISKYQYPKEKLLSRPDLLMIFFYRKVIYALSIPDYQNSLLLYSLPLILYLNLLSLWELNLINNEKINKFKKIKIVSLFISESTFLKSRTSQLWLLLVLINIFAIKQSVDGITLILFIIWSFLILRLKIKSRASFFIVFIFSLAIPILYLLGFEGKLKKISDWIYYFLLFGAFHGLIEQVTNYEKK